MHHDRMNAFVVAAKDLQPARAGLPHFPEGDLLFVWHARNSAKNRPQPELAIPVGDPSGKAPARVIRNRCAGPPRRFHHP
jgi:hypothetical protein